MKKLLISFFVSLCFFSLAFSFDFGLNIQNYTSFLKQDESQTFVQSNTALFGRVKGLRPMKPLVLEVIPLIM
jgi:hypothetical protein